MALHFDLLSFSRLSLVHCTIVSILQANKFTTVSMILQSTISSAYIQGYFTSIRQGNVTEVIDIT